ncbi:hypothetical protein AGMMS49991_00730 [Spirochaetia bacterium]|nr:hypothetical protein AGMMS49991_00730 [Spirochaetia bacterium]
MKCFLFDFMVADGRSMVPAIRPGTILMINRLAYGVHLPWSNSYLARWSLPKTGEVLIFFTPQGTLAVKRCGEVLEGGEFIALGDNSADSYDSRSYGPIPASRIVGKVIGIK